MDTQHPDLHPLYAEHLATLMARSEIALGRGDFDHLVIAAGQPSLPTSLASERACNPFLRIDAPAVRASLEIHLQRTPCDDIEAFATLRRWKDGFSE